MKTTIITLPTALGKEILKAMEKHTTTKEYLGLDKEGKMLMKLTYLETNQPEIDKLNEAITVIDKLINDFTSFLKAFMNEVVIEAARLVRQEQDKKLTFEEALKILNHGRA